MKRWAVIILAIACAASGGCGTRSVPATLEGDKAEGEGAPEVDIIGVYTPEYQPKS